MRLGRGPAARRVAAAIAMVAALSTGPSGAPGASSTADTPTLALSSDLRIAVRHGREVELEARVAPGDDWRALAVRLCGTADAVEPIAGINGGGTAVPGQWIRVPLKLLADEHRGLVLRSLFPEDRLDNGAWVHRARSGALATYDEGLWQVAEWFVGEGAAFDALARANGLTRPELATGQVVRVPADVLHPAFRPRERSGDGLLEYATDDLGAYALYRLKRGEALYSSVVVRFTGRTASEDVHAVAEQIRARNRIRDLTDIPTGYAIKIPLDLLEPEFLPAHHPRREEAETRREELQLALTANPIAETRGRLQGVLLILDPGHGGRDLGTINNGIWEHDYVYDVACRLKQMIERETAARVLLTLEDLETGCAPSAGDVLTANRQGTVLSTPPFLAREEGESDIAVNLRWYLANSIYHKTTRDGTDPDRVLFVSLHADSRHPSLRGLMVYVPGADYRAGTYGHASGAYRQYKEVREKPQIQFSKSERLRSEAVSRELADSIVAAFGRARLPIQPFQPVRDKVIRGKGKWVPAVLRGNAVPTKVLVEMVNLSNREDAALLGLARERERLARALLDALHQHFGTEPEEAKRPKPGR